MKSLVSSLRAEKRSAFCRCFLYLTDFWSIHFMQEGTAYFLTVFLAYGLIVRCLRDKNHYNTQGGSLFIPVFFAPYVLPSWAKTQVRFWLVLLSITIQSGLPFQQRNLSTYLTDNFQGNFPKKWWSPFSTCWPTHAVPETKTNKCFVFRKVKNPPPLCGRTHEEQNNAALMIAGRSFKKEGITLGQFWLK